MKIRNGFVSNSSSSSFVVIRKNHDKDNTLLLTPKEEKFLLDYGFKKVDCFYADQVTTEMYWDRKPQPKSYLKMLKKMKIKIPKKTTNPYFNYGYDITCNQDDVIYTLIKANISFEANCHYGHQTVIYKKNSKYFITVENFGVQAAQSNWARSYDKMCDWFKGKEAVTKTNVKEYLKREKAWYEKSDELLKESCLTMIKPEEKK